MTATHSNMYFFEASYVLNGLALHRLYVMDKDIVLSVFHSVSSRLGYNHPKPGQVEAVTTLVLGRDVFISLPTGYGKSLCYSCLPLVFDMIMRKISFSVIIVVSPLNALIKDQLTALSAKDIKAVHVNECFDNCGEEVKAGIVAGIYSIVFISPELLLTDKSWVELFNHQGFKERLVGLVVDEAHCIKKWYVPCFLHKLHITVYQQTL